MSTTNERRGLVAATVAAAILVAQQVAGKAARDALFLASFDAEQLPLAIAGGAILSLVAVVAMGRALASRGPRTVLPIALAINAAIYVVEWLAHGRAPEVVAVALYLHVAAVGSVLISAFWSLVRESSEPHHAKTFVARVTAGATFGGILGGLVTTLVARTVELSATFLVLAGANVVVAVILARSGPPASRAPEPSGDVAVRVVASSAYLRSIALLAAIVALLDTALEFAFDAAADRAYSDEASLATFFSVFYTATNTITFLVQASLGRAVLRRLGLGAALASLPAFVSLGLGLVLGAPLAALGVLRGGMSALANSTFRSGYEILFVPLPGSVARATKTLVDVAGARAGDLAGALAITAMLALAPEWPALPAIAAGGVALASLWLVRSLTRGYVRSLQTALGSGVVELGVLDSLDATTRRTLEDGTALDRTSILRAIAARDPGAATIARAAPAIEIPLDPSSRFDALTRGTPEQARAALALGVTPELVRAAVPLLANDELAADALVALRRVAPRAAGTLGDALLDPSAPAALRARIPRVLRAAGERALAPLTLALDDPSLEVRYHSSRALAHLRAGSPSVAPPADAVLAACMRELGRHGAAWSDTVLRDDRDSGVHDEPTSLDALVRARASRSLELVLTLLSVVVDAEPMRLAIAALGSEDRSIRGTAIELLENVVPAPVREPLIASLVGGRRAPPARSREQIVEELLRSQDRQALAAGHGSRLPSAPPLSGREP